MKSISNRGSADPLFCATKRFLWAGALLVLGIAFLTTAAHAQVNIFGGSTDTSGQAITTGMSSMIALMYSVMKFVAIILGCLGVWRLLEHDYKWMVGCFAACIALYMMPTIVQFAENIGSTAYTSSGAGTNPSP
jgi:hypothetical protein